MLYDVICEYQKFRADVFKICGFALMTPLGRFVLRLLDHGFRSLSIDLLIEFVCSIILFMFGIMAIQVGYDELYEE